MNEDKDPIGSLLKDMARDGKISPEAAGMEGEMVMPAMSMEQEPETESTALPPMSIEQASAEDMDVPEQEIKQYRFAEKFPNIAKVPEITEELADVVQHVESGDKWDAVNETSGALGLMQVIPKYAHKPGYGARGVFEIAESLGYDISNIPRDVEGNKQLLLKPDVNRIYGEEYLEAMLRRYDGDVTTALIAYNKGPGYANEWLASGGNWEELHPETQGYLDKINRRLQGEDIYGTS